MRGALLDAAAALFAARGPHAVSVREVAAAAGVNHGLVHRHFGGKEGLVAAVLERMAREIAGAIPGEPLDAAAIGGLFSAAAARASYWRILAWALLSGESAAELQSDFPTVRRLVEVYRERQRAGLLAPGADPAVIAGGSVALVLGWLLFEPFLLEATGLVERGAPAARAAVVAHLAALGGLLGSGTWPAFEGRAGRSSAERGRTGRSAARRHARPSGPAAHEEERSE